MLFSIYKKRFSILLLIIFCFVTIFNKIQITNAEQSIDPKNLADQVYDYLTKNYPPPHLPLDVKNPDSPSDEAICLTNGVIKADSLKDKSPTFCDKTCIGTYLTTKKSLLWNYIKTQQFDKIRDLAKNEIPKMQIQVQYPDPEGITVYTYTNTVCGSSNASWHAKNYQELIGLLAGVTSLKDVANAFKIPIIVNPNECTDTFISRFSIELSNYPFKIYTNPDNGKEKDICKPEYFNENNYTKHPEYIEKAKQCLTNLANDLRLDKDSLSLNPTKNSDRANQIEQLANALDKFSKCPNPANLDAIAGAQITALTGETSFTSNSTSMSSSGCAPNDCLCQAASEHISIFSPGTWVRAIVAAIALAIRAIMSWIANAFVWSFTELPKRLGGYVNFTPIYDAQTRSGLWYTMLDFANLGIVLGMIFMAIATIFRIEKYSWKKMLPKLLLVALLVNFSLVIMGVFVDISNYLSMTFLTQSANNRLGNVMQEVVTNTSCSIYNLNPRSFVTTMTAVTLAIILSGIFLFQFAGLLFYVATRIITIWICVATSPLAFLALSLDVNPIKNIVNTWRDRFTQAIISLPILAFTLYFVLIILNEQNGIAAQINSLKATGKDIDFILLIAYSIIIISLAQILRSVAKSIGVEQIEAGYNFVKNRVMDTLKIGLGGIAGYGLGLATQSGWYNNLMKGLSIDKFGGWRVIGAPLRGIGTHLYLLQNTVRSRQQAIDEQILSQISNNETALSSYFISASRVGKTESALRALQYKIKNGFNLRDNEKSFLQSLPQHLQSLPSAKEIYAYNPALKPSITVEEIANMYRNDSSKINLEAVFNTLGKTLSQDLLTNPKYGLLGSINKLGELARFIKSIPKGQRNYVLNKLIPSYLGSSILNWLENNKSVIYNGIIKPSSVPSDERKFVSDIKSYLS